MKLLFIFVGICLFWNFYKVKGCIFAIFLFPFTHFLLFPLFHSFCSIFYGCTSSNSVSFCVHLPPDYFPAFWEMSGLNLGENWIFEISILWRGWYLFLNQFQADIQFTQNAITSPSQQKTNTNSLISSIVIFSEQWT